MSDHSNPGVRESTNWRGFTLLKATFVATRRHRHALLGVTLVPFIVLFTLQLIDFFVIAVGSTEFAYALVGDAALHPGLFWPYLAIRFVWRIIVWLPLAMFAAACIRVIVSGPTIGRAAKFGWPHVDDARFVLTALGVVLLVSPVLVGLHIFGDVLVDWATPDGLVPWPDYLWDVLPAEIVRLALRTPTLWWVFSIPIAYRLASLALTDHSVRGTRLFVSWPNALKLFVVVILVWLVAQFFVQLVPWVFAAIWLRFDASATGGTGRPELLLIVKVVIHLFAMLVQVALMIAAIAIAYDVSIKDPARG